MSNVCQKFLSVVCLLGAAVLLGAPGRLVWAQVGPSTAVVAAQTDKRSEQAWTGPRLLSPQARQPIQIARVSVQTEIVGQAARSQIEVVFKNPNAQVLEGELVFPLAEGQSITGFALDIQGEMRPAVPIEKAKGQQIFEDVIRRRVDPALLEKTQGNNYKLPALSLGVVGALAAAGAFQVVGNNSWTVVFKPLAELVLVAVFEELLFRAMLLRILQNALGTRWALAISSLIFALAHFPNDGVSALGLVITVAAGVMFGAAYLKTGRLWLAAGLHFAWNFITGTVFSLPVSGGAAKGWIIGRLNGPEWLSGGSYGLEASAVTLLAVLAVTVLLARKPAGGAAA
eukprot:gene23749-30006_t